MSEQTRTVLKAYFEAGDKPTAAQFGDLIDSCLNYASDFKIAFGKVSQTGTNAPTLSFFFNNLGFVPTGAYSGVGSYTIDSVGNFDSAKTVQFIGNPDAFGEWAQITIGDGIDSLGLFSGSDASTPANGILSEVPFLILQIS